MTTHLHMEAAALDECDEQLIERFRAGGGGEPFSRLVARHAPGVTRLVHRLLGYQGEVEDVVQEVFVIAWEQLQRPAGIQGFRGFRGDSRFATWLKGIAVRQCRRSRRQWWRLKRRRVEGTRVVEPADAAAARDETDAAVRAAVAALPRKLREVIVLVYLEQMDIADAAATLKLSRGAIDVRLHRAREQLRKTLDGVMGVR